MHSQSGKRAVWKFVAIVAVVIVGLIIIGVISYSAAQEKERISFALVPVQEQVSLAQELLETDPITTREMITQALASLATLEKENQESNAVSLIVEEKQRLTTYLESISATSQLQELEVFYDLRLAKSDFIASGADISGNTLVVYDADMRQVLLLDHDSQQVALKDLSNTPVLKAVSAHLDSVFVLTDGIYSFPLALAQPQLQDSPEDPQQSPGQNTTSNELSEVRSPGDSNTSATLLDAYDRFVYIVNPEKRNIYRYAQTEDGYSEPVGWMKAATGLAYETLLSLSVDGSVWLTTNQGQIKKFVLGREEQFEIRGLDQAFDSEIYLYTNEKLNNLYVLDPNNSRVVVLDKNGNFVKQVESVSLGAANAITVSEELGKMFIVGGPILYQVTL